MDLFYRLNTFALQIAPLREPKDDIPRLPAYFLSFFSQMYMKKEFVNFFLAAEKVLCPYDWPGNIREFKNVVERIVVMENVATIEPEHLPMSLVGRTFVERRKSGRFVLPESGFSLEELEKDLIQQALKLADNNQTSAANLVKYFL